MLWIEASIAFAATMMVFSTIVTVIIETAHRIFRVREYGLKTLITHMYRDVLATRLGLAASDSDYSEGEFENVMTQIRYLPDNNRGGLARIAGFIINSRQLTSLSTEQFVERLAETPIGHRLSENAKSNDRYLHLFLSDLVSKYEEYGNNASEYFKRRAGLFSIVTALILVFSVNINAVDLFRAFVVESAAQSNLPINTKVDLFPIGWDNAPWHSALWNGSGDGLQQLHNNLFALLFWIGSLFFTAIMVGLGGPFWFDMYKKLSVFVDVNKKRYSSSNQPSSKNQSDWAQAFERAIAARSLQQSMQD